MAIATLIIATLLLKVTGTDGTTGMIGAIAIGGIICVIAAIAGDCSQDLKTGFIVGATPAKQQVGELIGVVASGFAIAGVMSLLNKAWGFGSAEIPAPQATLMKMIVEGIMDAKLPWVLVFMGVFLALALEVLISLARRNPVSFKAAPRAVAFPPGAAQRSRTKSPGSMGSLEAGVMALGSWR